MNEKKYRSMISREKGRHFLLRVLLPLFLLMAALLLFSACSSDKTDDSSGSSAVSAEISDSGTTGSSSADAGYTAPSLSDFKTAASAYGEVTDLTDQLTYESAVVTGNDRLNIIFMKASSPEEAERLIFEESEDSGDSASNPHIARLRSGSNFAYYEENVPADIASGTEAYYGYYLRVDGTVLLVTGAPEDSELVKETAGEQFEALGCPAE